MEVVDSARRDFAGGVEDVPIQSGPGDLHIGRGQPVVDYRHEFGHGEDDDDEQIRKEREEDSGPGQRRGLLLHIGGNGSRGTAGIGGVGTFVLALDGHAVECVLSALRLPEPEHDDDGGEADEGSDDVGEFDGEERGGDVLGEAEGDAHDEGQRPDLLQPATPVDEQDEEERHDCGEERGLVTDHGADVLIVDSRQSAGGDDRDGDGAEGYWRGVGHEDDDGGAHGGEADGDEHDTGDRDRGTESGERLEEAAEAEGDDDRLDSRVVGDDVDDQPEVFEAPRAHGELVEPDRGDDDPHDREQTEGESLRRRQRSETDGHSVGGDRDDESDADGGQSGPMGLPLQCPEGDEDRQQRQDRQQGRPQQTVGNRCDFRCVHGFSKAAGPAHTGSVPL